MWKKLRGAVRKEKEKEATLAGAWAGFFHHLSSAFKKLPYYKGVVYVGSCAKQPISEFKEHFKKGKVRWDSNRQMQ